MLEYHTKAYNYARAHNLIIEFLELKEKVWSRYPSDKEFLHTEYYNMFMEYKYEQVYDGLVKIINGGKNECPNCKNKLYSAGKTKEGLEIFYCKICNWRGRSKWL